MNAEEMGFPNVKVVNTFM